MKTDILYNIQHYVKEKLTKESSGHDYFHIVRVVTHAQKILKEEKEADKNKVLIAAWLHDIGDYKLHKGIDKTREIVVPLLTSLDISTNFSDEIIQIISEVSYKGGFNVPPSSMEAKIVQDADRLDAIGAIGIARAFAYGGNKGKEIFNPEEAPVNYTDFDAYQKSNSCTINHFYEKLLKLKDLMHTKTAKKMAEERHVFMIHFLQEFYKEVHD